MCYISEWEDLKPERQLGAQGAGLYDVMAATEGFIGRRRSWLDKVLRALRWQCAACVGKEGR